MLGTMIAATKDTIYRNWRIAEYPVSKRSKKIMTKLGYIQVKNVFEHGYNEYAKNATTDVQEWNKTLKDTYGSKWKQMKKK